MTTVTSRRVPVTVILAVVVILAAGLQAVVRTIRADDGTADLVVSVVAALVFLAVAYGLWRGNRIAWILGLVAGGLAVLSVFSGDWLSVLAGILLLVLLLVPQSRQWFDRRAA